MAIVNKPNTFSGNTTISSSEINSNFDTLYNEFNGSISAANLADDAVTSAKLADNAVVAANISSDSVTATKIDWASTGTDGGIWWEEIGRTTLGSAGDTLTVSGLPARKYLKIYLTAISTGGTIDTSLRLNNDSSNIYSHAAFYNNSGTPAVDSGTSLTGITVDAFTSASGTVTFSTIDISNLSTHSKRMVGATVSEQTSGAGSAPTPYNFTGKYVSNTQVSRIDFLNAGTGDFAIGSEVVVLGHN